MNIGDDRAPDTARILSNSIRKEPGLWGRAALTIILAGMLVVALNWAMNVTNANAKQVSSNLTHMQDGFGKSQAEPSMSRQAHTPVGKRPVSSSSGVPGPTLEPVDSDR